jgi:sedoheptulokinase
VKRTAAAWLEAFGASLPEEELYRRMEQAIAASPADAGGLVCEPFFRGTRRQPEARGAFRNVTPENFTPGNVARAVLRGIAEGMHSFLELGGEHAPREARRIVATGNGIRRNRLLVEMLEERFGLAVEVPGHEEEAAYGAARLALTQSRVR